MAGGESTADVAGTNNGTVAEFGTFGYGPGMVGQAFVSNGIHRYRVDVGNPTSLQLQDFTIEAWIKRTSPTDISLIQYKEHLADPVWLELSRQTGTGAPILVSDPNPAAPSRFYRVQVE